MDDIRNTIRSFANYLVRKFWVLLLALAFGAIAGLFVYSKQKSRYVAVSTFILEEKSSSGGGISGLASQFGLNLGSLGGGGSIFSGDNILEILKSKKVVEQVLRSPVENSASEAKSLADLYLQFSGLKRRWETRSALNTIRINPAARQLTPLQDSVLNVIYEAVNKNNLTTERTSKTGTIIKVQVAAEESAFARLMTQRLVEEASKLYLTVRVGTGLENIRQLQRRSDSLLVLLNNKSYRAAASQPLDINPGLRTATVPVEIANRDKTVLATLYAEVTKNLEASRLLLSQQTPVIQLLDSPGMLLPDAKKSALFFIAAGMLFAALCFFLGAFGFFVFGSKTATIT